MARVRLPRCVPRQSLAATGCTRGGRCNGAPATSTRPASTTGAGSSSACSMAGEGIPVLHVALVAAAILGAFSLLVMVQVLLIAQASARRKRLRDAFQERWRPRLAAASLGIDEAPAAAAPQGDREKRWWLQSWTRMQATLRGQAHERLNRLLCELRMDGYAVELLGRRDVRAQLVALA